MTAVRQGSGTDGIRGKVVAITGAGSGIGAATARLLAEGGARVVLAGRREDRLADLVGELVAEGGEAVYSVCDVTRRQDLAALVATARERFGRLDVLVGNAGIGRVAPLDDLPVDDWEAMIDVHVKGLLYGIAAALPVFREQPEGGQFVHTVSTAAYRTVPGQVVYSASKTAARTLTEGLRQEAGPSIRVSMVSPGFVATEFADHVKDPALRERLEEMKRKAIPPEAVARAIRFAIEQPREVDVNEIVVRPTAQQ
ncbi:SDR family oxidoreductase [Phaeacidiphilus oryzae]|uniref:SDR family oxidoreductase n=1 Tax=Phaeacidiphilus oryzae TaxID=348818 RepID=UPI0005697453|nr:SDR family oxidoreductase [Phaeacidiphilus oryzae]